MKKYALLTVVALLFSISGLLAQVVWDNSACLYSQSNVTTNVISKQPIEAGSLVFYSLDNQLVLEKLDNLGNPITDQVFDFNIQVTVESNLSIKKSYDNNFFIYWREENSLKIKKISDEGSNLWNSYLNIPIIDYSDRSIDEMQIVDDEESIYLLVNYQSDDYEEVLVSYQIDVINNIPQEINQNIIYEEEGVSSFTGALTGDGITYMWSQASEDKIFIKIGETIHELNQQVSYYGVASKECDILELNGNKTIYCLIGKYYDSYYNEGFSDIYIYDEETENIIEVFTNHLLLDVQRISDDEFLSVTIKDSLYFTKYNATGDILSSVSQDHYCHSNSQPMFYSSPSIKSFDCKLENGDYKIAIGFIIENSFFAKSSVYHSKLGIYSYNLATSQTSSVWDALGSLNIDDLSLYVSLGDTKASLLDKVATSDGSYYRQHFLAYDLNSQASYNPYQIALTAIPTFRKLNSFNWNGNNRVIMRINNSILENEVNDSGESVMENYQVTHGFGTILEKISENNYVLLYAYDIHTDPWGYDETTYDIKAKIYEDNGNINIEDISQYTRFQSFMDVEDGDGLWITTFSSDIYICRIIVNGVIQNILSDPLLVDNILMVKNNYLITDSNNQFLITKIDDLGFIAEGWTNEGYSFTDEYDNNIKNKNIFKYQNRLIFSYISNDSYKIFDINTDDLTQTTSYSYPCPYNSKKNDFIIGNKLYNIHTYTSNLTITCYDLNNDFAEVWQETIAENISNYDIKVLNNRFVIAYTQEEEGAERVYLKTISFLGNSDQYEDGFALPLNLEEQYLPSINVLDNNTIYVNRVEKNSDNSLCVYCDLIDLSYFVANSSEDVTPLTLKATNYPNPFNPETTISYNLPQAGDVSVQIYNLKGQLVKTLINEVQSAGNQKVIWKGNNNQNKQVSSGIYLYKIKTNTDLISGKMVLMK